MSYAGHQRHAHRVVPRVRIGILTASDSRTLATDESGDVLERLLGTQHEVVARRLVPDAAAALRRGADQLLDAGADVIVVNGGTGITPRDVTIEAFRPWFEKELPGFGETFRSLSYDAIGSGAWLSRATAATIRRTRPALMFLLPGSPDACRLAARRLILPELAHAVSLLRGVKPHG